MYFRLTILSIIIFLFLILRVYIVLYSVENHDETILPSTSQPITVHMCSQLPSSSKGYFRVDFTTNFTLNYTNICQPDDTLLIYILSKVNNFDRRQAIRRTWANKIPYEQLFHTCFIFLVGLGSNSSLNSAIRSEATTYGDIVQININETYQNIVYKEVGGLKWSYMYALEVPYLFKTDDNMIIDTILLGDLVKFLIENRTDHTDYFQKDDKIKKFIQDTYIINKYTLFKGVTTHGLQTVRQGKFAIQNVAWNDDILPSFCRGYGYIFSSLVRDRLYRASLCYPADYVPLSGDLFVSGFLANTAALRCSSWSMKYVQSNDGCSLNFQRTSRLLMCSIPMHIGRPYMEDYDLSWQTILNRHSITNETLKTMRRNRKILLATRAKLKSSIRESIVEEIQNSVIRKEAPIVEEDEID